MIGGPRVGIIGGAGQRDPYFSKTILNAHGDSLVDNSANPKTITVGGSFAANASGQKFGTGCFATTGSTVDYGALSASSDWSLGPGDFFFEAWVWMSTPTVGFNHFCSNSTVGGGNTQFQFMASNAGKLRFTTETTVYLLGTTTIPASTWTHVAVGGKAGTLYGFVNGTLDVSAAVSWNFSSTQAPDICNAPGYRAATSGIVKVDDLRLTKGLCRTISSFTPPTRPNPNF